MATRQTRALAKVAVGPSVLVLFVWMIVPLALTLYFSVLNYNLLDPGNETYIGFLNYQYFLTDPAFFSALANTLKLVGGVLVITVVGGILLGLGRALGETMAVTFVIGNSHRVHASILQPGTTISAALANEFTEAVGDLYVSSLIALGLILFVMTFIILAIAKLMLIRLEKQAGR